MIQELLGSGLISGERRINPITNNGTTILQAATPHPTYSHHHHSSPSSSPSATTTAAAPAAVSTTPVGVIPTAAGSNQSFTTSSTPSSSSSAAGAAGEHLRCPRCDSSNTKFCYYNNYNLTQPRHFCKTCRRYWTKGGALRNVPIGGGCRKNKSTSGLITSSSATFGKPAATITGSSTNTTNKLKSLAHVEFGTSSSSSSPSVFGASLYDLHLHPHHHQELPSSPILWASTPQTNSHHHFLSLLRSSSTIPPNPNPNPSSTATLPPTSSLLKDEANGNGNLFGTSTTATTTSHLKMFEPAMTGRNLGGWDTSSVSDNQQQQAPLLGLNYSAIPIWKGGSNGNGYLVGSDEPHHNTGMQEVYQRLKASTSSSSYDVFNDNNNMGSTSSSSSCFLSGAASSTVAGGGGFSGYSWSPVPAFTSPTATATTTASPWSDLPTNANNGTAYP